MAIFPIRVYPDPVLRSPAAPVEDIDATIERLVDDMLETMYDAPGVGLAAPQIGIPLRVIVFDIGEGPHVLINPELVETSGKWEFEEGCLSVPERYWPINRPGFARARGLDLSGEPVEYAGDELLGRVLQHEVDILPLGGIIGGFIVELVMVKHIAAIELNPEHVRHARMRVLARMVRVFHRHFNRGAPDRRVGIVVAGSQRNVFTVEGIHTIIDTHQADRAGYKAGDRK